MSCHITPCLIASYVGICLLSGSYEAYGQPARPKVIAHRGASGYCVEHTEAAKVLAHAQRADYIEQDVVLTKDLVFVVSHDTTMEATTNVEEVFPQRKRDDGKFYFIDFTWDELKQVAMKPRSMKIGSETIQGAGTACGQRILRLEEEIALIRALDLSLDRTTGLYIELKSPSFHRKETGRSMGEMLIAELRKQNVSTDAAACLIQSFEADELIDLKQRLHCPYPLIQLLGGRGAELDFEKIASYAVGIGPSTTMLATPSPQGPVSTGLVEKAKKHGLMVHPYTVRKSMQPSWSKTLDQTHRFLLKDLAVDGFFTDYPDLGRSAIDSQFAGN